ncbi:MAG: hypothetical protein VX481_03510 [Cyanobacteriota bacterium]|nr:hypothetical protein [Cyanobacteriota bacterium]
MNDVIKTTCLLSLGLVTFSHCMINPHRALAYPGDRPLDGSVDALCQYGGGRPNYCKVKVDRQSNAFHLWTPPGVEGALLRTFTTTCFRKGCSIVGPDFGYVQGPEKYRILEFNDQKIRFISLGDGQNPPIEQDIKILD